MRITIVLLLVVTLSSCINLVGERGNGVRVSESIEVDEFDRVEISGAFTVILAEEESKLMKICLSLLKLQFAEILSRLELIEDLIAKME